MVGRGKVGRDREGLMHTQFIRGKVGLGTGVVKGILNSVFKLILTMHFFTVYFISLGKKWSWSLVPGRVPAFSTDTLPEIMRVSVLIAGTRPGTIGHPVVIIL